MILKQTELIISLMFGIRHQQGFTGSGFGATTVEIEQMIQHAIEIFLLKYQPKFKEISHFFTFQKLPTWNV